VNTGVRVSAVEIARFLNARLFGQDLQIDAVTPIHLLSPQALSFASTFDENTASLINACPTSLIICSPEYKDRIRSSYVVSDQPRLDFLRVIGRFFAPKPSRGISPLAHVDPSAGIGKDVSIGRNSTIGPEVTIGDESIILQNVVISGRVSFGKRCVVKSNSVIGEEGFGFAYNEFGVPEHFPHIGSVEIGDDVWIGACSTVERATIERTVIGANCKVDDLVQIGHNCHIGENTLVMAGSILCGGAVLGKGCWIAPNTTIKEKVRLGDAAYTGLGAVVIEDVPENTVVVGNPARKLRKRG
jgi:UDP-3-O-[3-hydroxymyristoyl] glucosamine N-acyltransferase